MLGLQNKKYDLFIPKILFLYIFKNLFLLPNFSFSTSPFLFFKFNFWGPQPTDISKSFTLSINVLPAPSMPLGYIRLLNRPTPCVKKLNVMVGETDSKLGNTNPSKQVVTNN